MGFRGNDCDASYLVNAGDLKNVNAGMDRTRIEYSQPAPAARRDRPFHTSTCLPRDG